MGEMLNKMEASNITGINYRTLSKHVQQGILPSNMMGGRCIDANDLYYYAVEQWELGRVKMYPPIMFNKRLAFFKYGIW